MLVTEELVDQARTRRTERMSPRERVVLGVASVLFLVVAVIIAITIPDERGVDWPVVAILVVGYLVAGRVRFEFAGHYGTAEQLLIIPILALAPLPYVPLIIGLTAVLQTVPEVIRHREHGEQFVAHLADSCFCIPPVLVLAALAPGQPDLNDAGAYAIVFGAQLFGDLSWTLVRNALLDKLPLRALATVWAGSTRIDATFAPLAFLITIAAVSEPVALLTIAPLMFLLHSFARDREERWANAVELHRAYRGTVMLLSDVVEAEDSYTAEHSRSVVELVNAVADELGVAEEDRRELEFAAMLHDVGKIAIPNEILNKPSTLEPEEFEVMKTHTIEGQFLLDRVGGLLGRVGQIVRSCHERWDGGGYPDGLAGETIPFASRIVFCCDAYNAMTSDRVYRKALPVAHALRELEDNSGSQFDPTVVAALIRVIRDGSPVFSGTDEVRAMLASMPTRAVVREA